MIIPEYLKDGDIVGVTACSGGVGHKIPKYEKSLKNFEKYGFKVVETNNVRTSDYMSSDPRTRALELDSLVTNNNIKMINIASGGDFLYEMLPYVNFDNIRNNIKWIGGSSDPTGLIYTITTNLDIATIYTPCNMSGYEKDVLHQSYLDYFKIIRGNLVKQYKSEYYENEDGNFNIVNDWITFGKAIDCSGRLIGGCIDVLKDIIGTKYDKTLSFIEKYKYDRIIWYFDVYSLESEVLYRTLLQFKDAGWFKYTDLIVIGKVCVPSSETGFTYEEAVNKALSEYKVIYKFDVGHVKPSMTMINGMKARIVSNDKENYIEYI